MLRHLKRPELFLELARRLPQLRFRMVGGPSAEPGERELFEQIRGAAQAIPNLEFAGFVPYAEIGRHFDDARVFVNTSEWEGFPNTFLQSWSRSIPTVSFFDTASTMGGRPVVTAAGDLDDMTRSVATLMSDDAQWRDTGEHARAYVDTHHSVDAAASGYDGVFRRLCAAPRERLLDAARTLEQLDPNIQC
jgi:glycosyltransferase involved in cell wall biosynthesis